MVTGVAAAGCSGAMRSNGYVTPGYVDPGVSQPGISGIGIESQDLRDITDTMVRDILASPLTEEWTTPPRVIIDDTRFLNESNQNVEPEHAS